MKFKNLTFLRMLCLAWGKLFFVFFFALELFLFLLHLPTKSMKAVYNQKVLHWKFLNNLGSFRCFIFSQTYSKMLFLLSTYVRIDISNFHSPLLLKVCQLTGTRVKKRHTFHTRVEMYHWSFTTELTCMFSCPKPVNRSYNPRIDTSIHYRLVHNSLSYQSYFLQSVLSLEWSLKSLGVSPRTLIKTLMLQLHLSLDRHLVLGWILLFALCYASQTISRYIILKVQCNGLSASF